VPDIINGVGEKRLSVNGFETSALQAGAAAATTPSKAPDYVTPGFLYTVVCVVALLSSLLTVFAYDRVYATKILVFDLQDYLTKIRTDAANNKLTQEQYKARLDVLETSVLAVPKNTIIFTGDVILGKNAKRLVVPEQ
jgi:hypothetical protein